MMSDEERDPFLDAFSRCFFEMIIGMLVFKSGDRLSASQVLRTEWMRKWAIPEAEKTWGRTLLSSSSSERSYTPAELAG